MSEKTQKTLKVLLFLLLIVLPQIGCVDPCNNELIQEINSPKGRHKAVVFKRDCGATTSSSTQVSVLAAETKMTRSSGNVFVAEAAQAAGGSDFSVSVLWLNEFELLIRYSTNTRIFLRKDSVETVKIRYESS